MPKPAIPLALYPVILLSTLLLPSGNARADGWSLGVSGGYVDDVRVSTTRTPLGSYPIGADGTAFPSIQVLRRIGHHFGLSTHATYLPYGSVASWNRSEYLPIGVGVRYVPVSMTEWNAWPYVEFSPGLVWSRWRVGSYGDYRGTSVQPGFTTGFGMRGKVVGKVAMEVGFRFLFSADTKRNRVPGVTQTMEGLRQTAILAGLSYAL